MNGEDLIARRDAPHGDADPDGAERPARARPRFLDSRGATGLEIVLVAILALGVLVPGIWSYTLVDPWETHYAEVSRRMLQDDDWVHTQWQNEGFRSKPILTFWLIAGSMSAMGVGEDGGFSGEMTTGGLVMFAIRLPFVLFGVMGLILLWWMLARLVSRRVAWLSFFILLTTPFYYLIARQAITDMPLVGCLMGAIACFALALDAGDTPLAPLRGRITSFHVLAGVVVVLVGWQAGYYFLYFLRYPTLAGGVRFPAPHIILPGLMLIGLAGYLVWTLVLRPVRLTRQVYLHWFYILIAISVLAKGLPAIGLVGVICLCYVAITNSWRDLLRYEIPQGILLCVLLIVPWHFGMYLKDGRLFLQRYLLAHNFDRAMVGVHGERGTFDFFMAQLGIGMWPWVALLPGAMAHVVSGVTGRSRIGQVRLLVGLWAIVSVALFCLVQTKFHHYIFPAVPALAVLIAFWIEDLLTGRIRRIGLLLTVGAGIVLLVARDLMGEQKQLIELFVYRYDRPWPSGEPWNVDLSDPILGFGLAFAGLLLLLSMRSLRHIAMGALMVTALAFSLWAMNVYMTYAGMHWGMRTAIETYYAERQIQGQSLVYYGARDIADEWGEFSGRYEIRTVVPEHLTPGQPMAVNVELRDPGNKLEARVTLHGEVARIGEHRFWVEFPPQELLKLRPFIERGMGEPPAARRPLRQLDADRLIAWQLYWRGENFWTGDEIWGATPDTRTAFKQTDNKAFLQYLRGEDRAHRRYFVITEAGRAGNLRNVLPTQMAKDTYEVIDRSSNKFTLLSFTL